MIDTGTLLRLWRLIGQGQRWLLYDPNPKVVLVVQASEQQDLRGGALDEGWNHIVIR